MDAAIRLARHDDLDGILALVEGLVDQHVALDRARFHTAAPPLPAYRLWIARLIDEPARHSAIVAERGGRIVGYLLAEHEAECTHLLSPAAVWLHDLFVDVSARKLGVGGAMMRLLVERHAGGPGIRLITAAPNAEARAFFERLGFRTSAVEMMRG